MDWNLAAQVAQVFAVPVTAAGVLASLWIGVSTLRELRTERVHRVRPYLLFDRGGFPVPVELVDSGSIPGINPAFAVNFTSNRPKGNNQVRAKTQWGRLKNHGSGTAFNTKICFVSQEAFIGGECFKIDKEKLSNFPYSDVFNTIPAGPAHIPPGEHASFFRLPTPITHDYQHKIERLDCIISIRYEDAFKNKFEIFQEVRVWAELSSDGGPRVLLTFGDEVAGLNDEDSDTSSMRRIPALD